MSRVKTKFITILALAVLFVLALGAGIGVAVPRGISAAAATYSPSSVFAAGTGGEVGASEGEGTRYVQFTFNDGGKVHYRRDLALKWFEAAPEGTESALKAPGTEKYYSMTFAFPELIFSTFKISYESAEENITKDGLATNTLVFNQADGALTVSVENAHYDAKTSAEPTKVPFEYTAGEDVTVTFSAPSDKSRVGEFVVSVKAGEREAVVLETPFTNIGSNFLEYRSSASTTPSTPMTFEAKLLASSDKLSVTMKSLNGQTLALTDGRVTDDTEPVLVLDEEIYSFRLGQRFSLTYEAIDVLDDSVSVSRSYYMAKKTDGAWKKPSTENEDYISLTTSTFFMPTDDSGEEEGYVSIRFELDDGKDEEKYYVYLTWYAADESAIRVMGEGEEAYDYILVNLEAKGPEYTVLTAKDETKTNDKETAYEEIVEAYQKDLTEAAEKVSAGSGAYLYLPSLRALIDSKYADYRNLRFSVYYYKPSQALDTAASSATSLSYNNLRVEVDEVGEYKMRVIAQDAAGNAMKLYNDDKDPVTVSASNVWDIKDIPEFNFNIGYDGPSIEDAGEQSLGYRDNTYTLTDFEIVALDGYEKDYTLYRINDAAVPQGEELPATSDFAADPAEWMDRIAEWDSMLDESAPKCLVEIAKYNPDITEEDDEWERTDNAYEWDPDNSLSFRPQERGLYVMKVVVSDAYLPNVTAEGYQVIEVRNPIDTIPGQSKWLQNNITAVVLFSISAVLLVVIVILFVVKPSDKKVEDVDLTALKGKKKGKKE